MKDMDIDYSALSHMKSLDETDQEIPTSSKERRKIKVSSLTGKKDESKKKQKIEKIPKTLKMNDVEGSENKSEEFQLDKKHNRAISDISSQDDLEKESFTCGSSSKIGNVLRANLGPLEHTNRGNTRTESDKNSLKDVKILECVTDDDEDVGGGNQEVSTKHLFRRVLSSSEENISLMTPKDWDSDNAEDSIVTAPPKFPRKNISSGPKNTYKTASTTVYSESENNSSEMDDDDVDEEVKRKSRKRKKLSRVPTKKRNKPVYKSPVRRLGESDEENISDEGAGGLKLMRKQTEQRMQALINSLRNPQFEKQFESLKLKNTKPSTSTARKTKRGRNDSTFKFSGKIPLEQRKSSRLQKKRPEYSPDVIDELHETLRQTYFKKQSYKILESSLEIAENENCSELYSAETDAPVDKEVLDSENVEQVPLEPSVENLVQMPPPPPKPPILKSTKRSRANNDERLDKAFSILEASASVPVPKEENECQIFGKLVATKLETYSPHVRSIAQEELMKILFKADRGFYNNLSNQQPPMQCPPQSISHQNSYNYHYPPTFNYDSSPNYSNHPHRTSPNPNVTLSQISPLIATTPSPKHSPASNYLSNFPPNTPAASSIDNDDGSSEIYE